MTMMLGRMEERQDSYDIRTKRESKKITQALISAMRPKLGIGTDGVATMSIWHILESGRRVKINFSVTESRMIWFAEEKEIKPGREYTISLNLPHITKIITGRARQFQEFGLIAFRKYFIALVTGSSWLQSNIVHEVVHMLGDISQHKYNDNLDYENIPMEIDSFIHQAISELDREADKADDPTEVYGRTPHDYTKRVVGLIDRVDVISRKSTAASRWDNISPKNRNRIRKRVSAMFNESSENMGSMVVRGRFSI